MAKHDDIRRLDLYCPSCGVQSVEFLRFRFALLLAPNFALLQYDCPVCRLPLHVNLKLNRRRRQALSAQQAARAVQATRDAQDAQVTPAAAGGGLTQSTPADNLALTAPVDKTAGVAPLSHPGCPAAIQRISYNALPVVDPDTEILPILEAPPLATPEARQELTDFHEQLERLDSVDDALRRIDARRHFRRPPTWPKH